MGTSILGRFRMPMTNIKERLNSLYQLRKKLCDNQKKEMQLEEIKDWVTSQLIYLKTLTKNKNVSRSEINIRIDDIL